MNLNRQMSEKLLEQVVSKLTLAGNRSRGNYTAWCPFHPDGQGRPPHQPNLHVSEKGFYCFACGEKGGLWKLAKHLGIDMKNDNSEKTYDYKDADGNLVFQVVRFSGKKKFLQRRPDGNGDWFWNLDGVTRVLYKFPELLARADERVFVAEGEKDVECLMAAGLLATTNSGGAGKWRQEYSEALKDRDVIVVPDNDEPGKKHGSLVANSLLGIARSVRIVELPGLKDKGDVTDWLNLGHSKVELCDLVTRAEPISENIEIQEPDEPIPEPSQRKSQADKMVKMVLESDIVLFTDQRGEAFAHFQVDDHKEIHTILGRHFKRYLCGSSYKIYDKAPGYDSVRNALNIIEAEAHHRGIRHRLFNRVAYCDDAIWYDLSDEKGRAVRICEGKYEVVKTPPILFYRYSHQIPQVVPEPGGQIEEVFDYINVQEPKDRILLLSLMLSYFIPEIPHPICILYGPHGAAKTSAFACMKQLIDPSICETMALPKDELSLTQVLSHHWAIPFDNISKLPDWASDALCRAVTGEGSSKRSLYTDDDDFIYSYRRCIGINGINIAARKSDLLDRALLIGLELVADDIRKEDRVLKEQFAAAKPMLLGAIFDVLSRALIHYKEIKLKGYPRMADFALWGCAFARAMGYADDDFISAYSDNIEQQSTEVIQGNPIASLIIDLLNGKASWDGLASKLLRELNELAEKNGVDTKSKYWPKAANSLSRRINELIPNLKAYGIEVKLARDRKGSQIRFTKQVEECEMPF